MSTGIRDNPINALGEENDSKEDTDYKEFHPQPKISDKI
jgi:hypothetical protein